MNPNISHAKKCCHHCRCHSLKIITILSKTDQDQPYKTADDIWRHPLSNRYCSEMVLFSSLYPSQTYMFKLYISHITAEFLYCDLLCLLLHAGTVTALRFTPTWTRKPVTQWHYWDSPCFIWLKVLDFFDLTVLQNIRSQMKLFVI